MPYGMMPPEEEEPQGSISTYGSPTSPVSMETLQVDPAQQQGSGMGSKMGGIAGLGGLLAAAIAGPKSNMGHLLSGGVTEYAKQMEKKQLDKHASDSAQHQALVKSIYAKVPELSQLAPDNPGVQELQKLWADALADDNIISPKEAADISAKIMAIEGSARAEGATSETNRQAANQRKVQEEGLKREMYKILQASSPQLQGIPFEEASKNPALSTSLDKLISQQAQRRDQAEQAKMSTGTVNVGGQPTMLPADDIYRAQQDREGSMERARVMAAAQANNIQNRGQVQADLQGQRMDQMAALQVWKQSQETPWIFDPSKKQFDPQAKQLLDQAIQILFPGQVSQGGQAPQAPPSGMPPGGPSNASVGLKMNPPPGMPSMQGGAPGGGGKPLPPNIDPRQLTPEQKAKLQAAGFQVQ